MLDVVQRFIRAWTYQDMPWREAQDAGLLWAPLRKPHENALDEHWLKRKSLRRRRASRSMAAASAIPPANGSPPRRAGRSAAARRCWARTPRRCCAKPPASPACRRSRAACERRRCPALHGKPFPLQGVKILDFAWFLASAGGTRFLAAMGAESYKVEWKDNPDTRLAAMAPVGGRAARDAATGPLPGVKDPDMGGQFNNKNAGKRGISLNIRHPKGLQIAKDLVRICDVVAEGFSPGVLERLGLGYDVMKQHPARHHLHPAVRHGRARHLWPDAHGRPGRRGVRRPGRHVGPAGAGDAGRLGLFLPRLDGRLRLRAGAARRAVPSRAHRRGAVDRRLAMRVRAVPDRHRRSSTGRPTAAYGRRYGNRSPYKPAAPHGAYRCAGNDRWIAIACFTEAEWHALGAASPASMPGWTTPASRTLADRLLHQDALDAAVGAWTAHAGRPRTA